MLAAPVLSVLIPILFQLPADTAVQQVAQSRKLGAAAAQMAARGQLDSAYVAMNAASALRPMHPGLLRETARLAARTGKTAPALTALTRLADWGLVFPLDTDSAFSALRADVRFKAVQSTVLRNQARIGASVPALQLDDSVDIAEGLVHDGGSFLVGSVRNQSVNRYRKGSRTLPFIGSGKVFSTLGFAIDDAKQTLWLSSTALNEGLMTPADSVGRASLRQYDVWSGRLIREYAAPAGSRNTFGDVLIAASGDVFVADSRAGAIYRAQPGSEALTTALEPGMLLSVQGMVEGSTAGKLIVADYAMGLAKVDVATGEARVLGFPSFTTTLIGIDGLYRYGKDIIAVQNGVLPARVLRITLDASEDNVAAVEVLEQNHPNHNEPSSGVIVGNHFYYIGNSQWAEFDGKQPKANARMTRPVILDLTLPAAR